MTENNSDYLRGYYKAKVEIIEKIMKSNTITRHDKNKAIELVVSEEEEEE